MTTVRDVPADALIAKIAENLRDRSTMSMPEWAGFVKTGVHREKVPENPDWWSIRAAALLRKIALKGPIGVNHLASEFGGRSDSAARPSHSRRGSRKIIRTILQQLEEESLIESMLRPGTEIGLGRAVTSSGHSLLDNMAHEIKNSMVEDNPRMALY